MCLLKNLTLFSSCMQAITILEKEFGIIAEFDAEDLLTSGIQVENLLTSYLMQFRDVVSVDCSKLASLHFYCGSFIFNNPFILGIF